MNRRQFIAAIGAAAVAVPALAQPSARKRVGIYLTGPRETTDKEYLQAFFRGMRELGWIEGQNVIYEHAKYPSKDQYIGDDKAKAAAAAKIMREVAAELIERKPDVIWLPSSISARALLEVARKAGAPIPVVGAAVSDVVGNGFAESLSRPGKNFTGMSNLTHELGAKRFEYLRELMPKLARVGVLMIPENANCKKELYAIEQEAKHYRIRVIPAAMQYEEQAQAEAAFLRLSTEGADAVLIAHHPLFQTAWRNGILPPLSQKYRIPAVGHRTYFVPAGALFSYSSDLGAQMSRSAVFVDKIIKGMPPGEIPIENPTKFEFVINTAVVKTYGLTIPQTLKDLAKCFVEGRKDLPDCTSVR